MTHQVSSSRIRGCLLGGAIGDALGNPIEFSSIDNIRRRHGRSGLRELLITGPGETAVITDDTQMTLFTAEGLIRHRVEAARRQVPVSAASLVHRSYLRWLDTQSYSAPPAEPLPHRDGWLREQTWLYHRRAPGNACLSGLRHDPGETVVEPGEAGPINPDSKGCGTVMRSAPFGLYYSDPVEAFIMAARCALFTHGHPTGYFAAAAMAAIVGWLSQGVPLLRAVARTTDLLTLHHGHTETADALRAAVSASRRGEPGPEQVEKLGGGWVAEEALAIAVYCALAIPDPAAVGETLLLAVNHSGDSDSTGAICGNLLGAWHGKSCLPTAWLATVEHTEVITAVADDLAEAARESGGRDFTSAEWMRRYPGH